MRQRGALFLTCPLNEQSGLVKKLSMHLFSEALLNQLAHSSMNSALGRD